MNAIVTSSEAQQLIDFVSPIYGDAYAALWLFQVIGIELDDLRLWVDSLKEQAFPPTATWSLAYWESLYQIVGNSVLTTEQRQNNLLLKKLQRAPINPFKMRSIVSTASGVPTKIKERTSPNSFTIQLTALPENVNTDNVKIAVNNIKPAHLSYNIEFVQGTQTTLYYGGFLSIFKKFTIGQVN
jgi:Uncharacterized protein conserved in bacteria (DUF2313).